MHVRRVTAAVAVASLGLLTLPGSAQERVALPSLRPTHAVTPQVQPLSTYVAAGLSPRDAARRVLLDRLAAQGLPLPMLQHVEEASSTDEPSEYVDLLAVGDLDGRGGRDVLEQRLVFGPRSSLHLVARDGRTGRVLWHRSLAGGNGITFAAPAKVAAGERDGVLLITFGGFDDKGNRLDLTALDGAGRTRWTRAVVHKGPEAAAPPGFGTDGSGGSFDATSVWLDRPLRGRHDIAVLSESVSYAADGFSSSIASQAWLEGVDEGNGALRTLVPSVASTSGVVSANLLPDVDGDGSDELAVVEGGDAQRVRVLRAADGKVVWTRTDLPVHEGGFLGGVGSLLGGRAGGRAVDDLVFLGDVDPGVLAKLPVQPGLPDPSRAAHGTVALLHGADGRTAWSRSGDSFVALGRAGVPAVGVVTETETSSATSDSATVTLAAVDAAGAVRWERSESAAVDHGPDDFTFVGAYAVPVGDLDGDRGAEVALVAFAYDLDTDTEVANRHLLRSRDGSAVPDQKSAVLFGGVTSRGFDRWTAKATASGPRLTVTSGRDGRVVLVALVPASSSTTITSVYGDRLDSTTQHDLFVVAKDAKTSVVALVGPDGRRLWSVSRAKGSAADGTLRR